MSAEGCAGRHSGRLAIAALQVVDQLIPVGVAHVAFVSRSSWRHVVESTAPVFIGNHGPVGRSGRECQPTPGFFQPPRFFQEIASNARQNAARVGTVPPRRVTPAQRRTSVSTSSSDVGEPKLNRSHGVCPQERSRQGGKYEWAPAARRFGSLNAVKCHRMRKHHLRDSAAACRIHHERQAMHTTSLGRV
jgi:hypothetical protein